MNVLYLAGAARNPPPPHVNVMREGALPKETASIIEANESVTQRPFTFTVTAKSSSRVNAPLLTVSFRAQRGIPSHVDGMREVPLPKETAGIVEADESVTKDLPLSP